VVEGALEVAEDALRSCEMGLTRVVHVEPHLLDHIDVRPGEGDAGEPNQAVIRSRVTDEPLMSKETLALVSTVVEQSLQSLMLARSRIFRAY
jgi:hypothetical protein